MLSYSMDFYLSLFPSIMTKSFEIWCLDPYSTPRFRVKWSSFLLCKLGWGLFKFPMAAVTNYHQVSDLKTKFITLQFWRSELWNGSHRAKAKVLAEPVPTAGSKGGSLSCLLQLLGDAAFLGSRPLFPSPKPARNSWVFLTSHHPATHSLASLLHFLRTLVFTLRPLR